MRLSAIRAGLRLLTPALLGVIALLATASPAAAADDYPCGSQVMMSWSAEPIQPCPLTSPTGPGEGFPLYREPIANPQGKTPPAPAGYIYGANNKYFVCQKVFPNAIFYHPTNTTWHNYWWAYTRTTSGVWGWISEVYFRGGAENEPDYGLRGCPPPPVPTPTPTPTPEPPPPPPPGPCWRTPASGAAEVEVNFTNQHRTITVPYERRPLVRGSITAADGTPLADAALCVGVQREGRGKLKAVGSVVADAHGHFSYRLDRGISRRVWFVHRDPTGAEINSLMVHVRAPVVLGASRTKLRNGQSVNLRGRLRVAPRGGLLVEMQALRGHKWQTFATTKTKRDGRYSYRYRFTRTYSFQTYQLRAQIGKQVGSPFVTGVSKPVTLRVHG